jgi:MOSC domain-containing protein YiiM
LPERRAQDQPCGVHLTADELDAGLDHIRQAPADGGTVQLIVRRPAIDEREVLDEAELDLAVGVVGDNWSEKASTSSPDGGPHPEKQLTVMNARCTALIAGEGGDERWAMAGDQLYLDFDIGVENLPAGSRLALGTAVIEITEPPHTGCHKFTARFGLDALRFVNSEVGKQLRLRGANAVVISPGTVRRGDTVTKLGK